jgi:hypothetical protein
LGSKVEAIDRAALRELPRHAGQPEDEEQRGHRHAEDERA